MHKSLRMSTRRRSRPKGSTVVLWSVAAIVTAGSAANPEAEVSRTLVAVLAHADDEGPIAPVLARYARNKRLGDAVHQWAFCSLRGSPGATAYYQALRSRNIGHQAALRQLANRLVGILHGCLRHHTHYDEHTAWAHRTTAAA